MKREGSSPLGLYTIGIAALFLAGFFLLVVFGAGSYRNTVSAQNDNMASRALLSYLSTTVKGHDSAGAVRVEEGTEQLTDRLRVTAILPKPSVIARQKRVFDALYRKEPVEANDRVRASKERNVSSVMLRFTYAGRSILLTGDRYAADFEDLPIDPCDVLKLPHHGDPKSMTPALLDRLSPRYAVISCQSDPAQKKDRPNAGIVVMLESRATVYCTENKPLPTLAPSTHNGIRITIADDGTIACETE